VTEAGRDPISRPMSLPRPSRPAAVFADLLAFFRGRERHDYIAAALAVLITGFVVFAFNHDSRMERQPQIVFVESWPATRTDDQIKAEQKVDAAAKQKAMDERRDEFRKLADQMGIDYKK
jgi:hypothetical protein